MRWVRWMGEGGEVVKGMREGVGEGDEVGEGDG